MDALDTRIARVPTELVRSCATALKVSRRRARVTCLHMYTTKDKTMKSAMQIIGAMLVIVGISACATQTADALREQGHESLSGSELRAIYDGGGTLNWKSSQYSGTTDYMADGSATLHSGSKDFDGTWRIADGKLCTQYEGIRDGEETCMTVFEVDGQYKFFDGNELSAWGSFEEPE